MEEDKDQLKRPVPYVRFKELVDKVRELKTENERLRAHIQLLENDLKERPQNK